MRVARWAGVAAFVCAGVVLADAPPPPKGKLPAADFKLAAGEYAKEYRKDRRAAEAKYKGKVVEVHGTAGSAAGGVPGTHSYVAVLTPDPAAAFPPEVMCLSPDPDFFAQFGRGQTVRVRGTFGVGGMLTGCEVVEKGADTRALLSAAALAKEFTADREKARENYDRKTLVVSGTIAAIKPNGDRKYLELTGDGKTVIECNYSEPRVVEKYKVGQAVKVYGEIATVRDGTVNIAPCHPVSK